VERAHTADLYWALNDPPDGFAGPERYVHVIASAVFIDDRPAETTWDRHFVGLVDGHGWWAVDVPTGADDPSDGAAVDLFGYHGRATDAEWCAAGRAVQVVEWARTHRYCGRCGAPTEPSPNERGRRCPSCTLVAYPRVAPAMITLVTRGEGRDQEALLARGANFRVPMYSCLAGFVEPGEDLEGAVVREVREEVGITVGAVRYVASQPWPFPHSLMCGFRAEHVSGDIEVDGTEIVDANWYRRDDLPVIPPGISIARTLIDRWVAEA
jgi:NAD+ diphosphatase